MAQKRSPGKAKKNPLDKDKIFEELEALFDKDFDRSTSARRTPKSKRELRHVFDQTVGYAIDAGKITHWRDDPERKYVLPFVRKIAADAAIRVDSRLNLSDAVLRRSANNVIHPRQSKIKRLIAKIERQIEAAPRRDKPGLKQKLKIQTVLGVYCEGYPEP